jgi:hypothetical protein
LPTCFLLVSGGCLYLAAAIAEGRIGLYVRQSTPLRFWLHVGYGVVGIAFAALVLCWAVWTTLPNRENDIRRVAALAQRWLKSIDRFVAQPRATALLYVILLVLGALIIRQAVVSGRRIGGGIGSRTMTPTLFWEEITLWVLGLIVVAARFREWIRRQLSKPVTDSDRR